MIRYSIADLEHLTGIKAHTIRIWEKRYDLIRPFRTSTNIRYYDNDQMRKLVNVAALIRSGMKISKISRLTSEQIAEELNKQLSDKAESEDSSFESFTAQLINAGLEFDENTFNKVYNLALLNYGMYSCYEKIILPLMNRVGMYWATKNVNPAQEHFISNLVKQKLMAATDSLPPSASSQPRSLLFLPQDEHHEIGLLMAKYILRNAGKQVIYLGQHVPFENLKSTVEQTRPEQLLFFLIQTHQHEVLQEYIELVAAEFKNLKIFIAGFPDLLSSLKIPHNIMWIATPQEFTKMLS